MNDKQALEKINEKIRQMQRIAKDLSREAQDFPALARNMVRIDASLKMLELDISDLTEL